MSNQEIRNSNEVSVVIPTYKGSKFIADALNSVFVQTRLPEEIVVVDDRSPDDTVAIVESLAQEVSIPIRVIRLLENSGGPSKPLNVGIESARGEVIVVLEQDDVMRPQRIASQLKAVLTHPECSLATGGLAVKGNKAGDLSPIWPDGQFSEIEASIAVDDVYSVIQSNIALPALLKKNFGTNSSFCFTKEWCKRIGGFDESIRTCADLDFILRAVQAGPIVIVNETIFEYQWRGDSLHRQSANESALEATMVRLRASSQTPEWAGEHLGDLRYSAISLAGEKLRLGKLSALSDVFEVFYRHKGLSVIAKSLRNRTVGQSQNKEIR